MHGVINRTHVSIKTAVGCHIDSKTFKMQTFSKTPFAGLVLLQQRPPKNLKCPHKSEYSSLQLPRSKNYTGQRAMIRLEIVAFKVERRAYMHMAE